MEPQIREQEEESVRCSNSNGPQKNAMDTLEYVVLSPEEINHLLENHRWEQCRRFSVEGSFPLDSTEWLNLPEKMRVSFLANAGRTAGTEGGRVFGERDPFMQRLTSRLITIAIERGIRKRQEELLSGKSWGRKGWQRIRRDYALDRIDSEDVRKILKCSHAFPYRTMSGHFGLNAQQWFSLSAAARRDYIHHLESVHEPRRFAPSSASTATHICAAISRCIARDFQRRQRQRLHSTKLRSEKLRSEKLRSNSHESGSDTDSDSGLETKNEIDIDVAILDV